MNLFNSAMKNCFLLFTALLLFSSCKKNGLVFPVSANSSFVTTAQGVLKSEMSPQNFEDLNWSNTTVCTMDGKPAVIQIQSKTDNTKVMYYGEADGVKTYNWVRKNLTYGTKTSGTIEIMSVKGVLLNTFTIKDNKVVVNSRKNNLPEVQQVPVIDGPDLPDVTVSTYTFGSSYMTWDDLYYLFNEVGGIGGSWYYAYTPANNVVGGKEKNTSEVAKFAIQNASDSLLVAKITTFATFKTVKLTDQQTFYFCNTSITFNTDLNNNLINGTQQVGFVGIGQPGIGIWTQLPVQSPDQVPDNTHTYCDFTVVGQFAVPYLTSTTGYYETLRIQVNMKTGTAKVWYMLGNNP